MNAITPRAGLLLAFCCWSCTGEAGDEPGSPAGAVEVDTTGMQLVLLSVEGMTCPDACAPEVQRQLAEVQGVGKVEVDFEAATARCWVQPGFDSAALAAALAAEGMFSGTLAPPDTSSGDRAEG